MRASNSVQYYVFDVELLSSYSILGMCGYWYRKNWNDFKALGSRVIFGTVLVIASTYFGSAIVANIILVMIGGSV